MKDSILQRQHGKEGGTDWGHHSSGERQEEEGRVSNMHTGNTRGQVRSILRDEATAGSNRTDSNGRMRPDARNNETRRSENDRRSR